MDARDNAARMAQVVRKEDIRKIDKRLLIVGARGYQECRDCGGLIIQDSEWLGEDDNGKGHYMAHYTCEDCDRWLAVKEDE